MLSKARLRLVRKINEALENSEEVTITPSELRMINIKASQYWYDHYQENDSPKGETIPGVNFRLAA